MAAPKGNQNATRAKSWRDALHRVLTRYENKEAGIEPGTALAKIAEMVVMRALAGDKDAWQEIGNRLDGKPHQSLDVGFSDNRTAQELSDDELAHIATGGRSRDSDEATGPHKPPGVH